MNKVHLPLALRCEPSNTAGACHLWPSVSHLLFLMVAAFFLAGCVTKVIKSEPDRADVYKGRELVGQTSYEVKFPSSWTGELRKEGYVPKRIYLSKSSPPETLFTLEKDIPKVTLTSVPPNADVVTQAGELVGNTPITIVVSNAVQVYEVRLESYQSQSIKLTPSSPKELQVDMGKQITGFVLPVAVIGTKGLEVQFTTVFADRDVIERSTSARPVRRLTDFPETRVINGGALSPDGKRLMMDVFDQEPAPDKTIVHFSNLWSVDVGSGVVGGLLRNTDGVYIDESPCFSPDGTFVYFAANRAGKNSIFRMPANGKGGLGLVTTGTTIDRFPSASPDSQTLMWTAFTEGTTIPQLWSLALLTNGLPTGLPLQIREGQDPHWSPDGKTILYCVPDRNIRKLKIWTMQPDGSQPTQLTTGSSANDIHPCWSPDGSKILFTSDRGVANGKPNYDIWIMNSDGSNPKQLTTNGSHDDHPIFSPDGKTIYFRSNRGLKWDVWVMGISE